MKTLHSVIGEEKRNAANAIWNQNGKHTHGQLDEAVGQAMQKAALAVVVDIEHELRAECNRNHKPKGALEIGYVSGLLLSLREVAAIRAQLEDLPSNK